MVLYAFLMSLYNIVLFFVFKVQTVDVGTYIGYSITLLLLVMIIEFIFGILIVSLDIESGFIWGVFTTQFYDYDVESAKEFIGYNFIRFVIICIALVTTVLVSTVII